MKKNAGIILSFLLLFLTGCSKDEIESKSMEQIYQEEGVPVKIQPIAPTTFEKRINYRGVLTGIRQSSAHAAFGDKVEKVHVKIGDYVKKDQVLVSFPTDAPSAQYSQAKAGFESIQKTYNRMKSLLEKGAISQQDFDNVETQYEVTKADWETVAEMVRVKAPISGYVTKINVSETDFVARGAELMVIANTDQLKTRIYVTEKDYPLLEKGQIVEALWNDFTAKGKITQIDRAKDRKNQGFGVMMEFENPNHILPSNITAELHIIIQHTPDAIVLDKKNITTENKGNFVFVESNGKAIQKKIELGNRDELKFEILSGLNVGDKLIVEGHKMLKDGQKVKLLN
jgi:RND family efflux transporter MFP subunit